MKILGIESASMVASVAILDGNEIIAEYTINYKKTHSQTLLPMIDEIVKMVEADLNELDAIAISGGPGSFTGLRIGAATAKGLGLALNKKIIHVPTLDALGYNMFKTEVLICPIMNARRNQVYNGLYHYRDEFEVVRKSRVLDIKELIEEIANIGEEVVFLGDGVPVYRDIIDQNIKVKYSYAPAQMNLSRGASVAALGALYYVQGRCIEADEMVPDYLRKSQAERERDEKLEDENNIPV